jgi:hypothetical protein
MTDVRFMAANITTGIPNKWFPFRNNFTPGFR